ncbi:uncharacterized protein LOC124920214 [Impatiens glandulifera]|uniref:uncharacterized protein LOC124920214 n=1 Tax=Impatiens glandulifera TaxID=253017 RepID=UPI001FB0C466|nr:uncharacterized protein LOC124920214 [Impatiens glandulifera]
MLEICLMASHGFPPTGIVFDPEQGISRFSKDYSSLSHEVISRQEMMRLGSFGLRSDQVDEQWKFPSRFANGTDQIMRKHVIIDSDDVDPNSMIFNYGMDEKSNKHEKIQFLMSGTSQVEMGVPQFGSNLLDIGFQNPLYHRFSDVHPEMAPFVRFTHRSEVMFEGSQLILNGASTEMKDLLPIIDEYYLAKDSNRWNKQSLLVPYFDRSDFFKTRAKVHGSNLALDGVNFAPLKSRDKIKQKSSQKKKNNRKVVGERDLYKKNYFRACESLLSILMDKNRDVKKASLSLKKSGPELSQLLTQFSASIAGTGIAVLLSVVCKVAYGSLPLCSSKLVTTGIGLGLVWLSWAVNKLRDTVIAVSKITSAKPGSDNKIVGKLDCCVNEIFFRAGTLIAMAFLRFA